MARARQENDDETREETKPSQRASQHDDPEASPAEWAAVSTVAFEQPPEVIMAALRHAGIETATKAQVQEALDAFLVREVGS